MSTKKALSWPHVELWCREGPLALSSLKVSGLDIYTPSLNSHWMRGALWKGHELGIWLSLAGSNSQRATQLKANSCDTPNMWGNEYLSPKVQIWSVSHGIHYITKGQWHVWLVQTVNLSSQIAFKHLISTLPSFLGWDYLPTVVSNYWLYVLSKLHFLQTLLSSLSQVSFVGGKPHDPVHVGSLILILPF